MVCSDNVVCTGLTLKFKNVKTLCSMLNYKGESAESKIFQPVIKNQHISIFRPPVPDCAIVKIEIPQELSQFSLIPRDSASVLLIVLDTAKVDHIHVVGGSSLFVPASQSVPLKDILKDFLAFQGVANV